MSQYHQVNNCFIDDVDGYGYAFVPGSKDGVVLMDMETKDLLESLPGHQINIDELRIRRLIDNGLVVSQKIPANVLKYTLKTSNIRSMSTWLHITNDCNLDCSYCYIANKHDRRHMSIEIARKYIDKLEQTVRVHELQSVAIRLTGGEPTLNRPIIEYVVNECEKRFLRQDVDLKLILITNGVTLSTRWLNYLSKHSIILSISLDGIGKVHNALRPIRNGHGESFKQVKHSIDLCISRGMHPQILTTITEVNIEGIPVLSKYLIDNNLPFRYGLFRDYDGSYESYQEFVERVLVVLRDCYLYYADSIRKKITKFKHQLCDIHINRRSHLRACNVGYSGVAVSHLGDVFVCQSQMDKQPLGNLDDATTFLQMAWSQETIPGLTEKGVLADNSPCIDCPWALICGGGCSIANVSYSGVAQSKSPYCKVFTECIPLIIRLKALDLINRLPNNSY